MRIIHPAGWQSGHAAACKAVYAGSIPTSASNSCRHSIQLLRPRVFSKRLSYPPGERIMGTSMTIVQQAYEAFGRKDVPTILELVADEVDWEFVGSASLPYAGRRRNRNEVRDFFAAIPRTDDIHAFEPREFIEAGGEHVTML